MDFRIDLLSLLSTLGLAADSTTATSSAAPNGTESLTTAQLAALLTQFGQLPPDCMCASGNSYKMHLC